MQRVKKGIFSSQHLKVHSVTDPFGISPILPYRYECYFLNYFIISVLGCTGSWLLSKGFLWLQRMGATLRCGAQAFHRGGVFLQSMGSGACGFQQPRHRGLLAVARGLQSMGSVTVIQDLRCSVVCGIFSEQGSNLCSLHWHADSLPLSHQESSMNVILMELPPYKEQTVSTCLVHR